ncbi:MAG: hypothetical protein EZS28_002372 [Streblomastix strix]|uniref:Uncharacterized protein n=1 Tax=Streblomastix strix TaxID=222440 RepID=A0A5J4X4E4_9EUKA|nr:MAG: hypothetical protein EZS28_002372 [Streblomastix strix]
MPSGERYIASHKVMKGYSMKMVDPDSEDPLPEFSTTSVKIQNSLIAWKENKNHFLDKYVPIIAEEYKTTNQIEKWGKGEYISAASTAWKEVQRGLMEEIDPAYDWTGANDEELKQAASQIKKQIRNFYFANIVEDEDGFVRLMDQVHKQVSTNVIAQAIRKQA